MNTFETLSADLRKVRRGDGLMQWLTALAFNQSFKSIALYRLTHNSKNRIAKLGWGGKTALRHSTFYLHL